MELIRGEAIKVEVGVRSFHSPAPGFLQGGLKVGILGSQFMERLETTGYTGVSKWHRNVSFCLRYYCKHQCILLR